MPKAKDRFQVSGIIAACRRFKRISEMALRESNTENLNCHSYQIACALDYLHGTTHRLNAVRSEIDAALAAHDERKTRLTLVRKQPHQQQAQQASGPGAGVRRK